MQKEEAKYGVLLQVAALTCRSFWVESKSGDLSPHSIACSLSQTGIKRAEQDACSALQAMIIRLTVRFLVFSFSRFEAPALLSTEYPA
jgi:hypothetical protein